MNTRREEGAEQQQGPARAPRPRGPRAGGSRTPIGHTIQM